GVKIIESIMKHPIDVNFNLAGRGVGSFDGLHHGYFVAGYGELNFGPYTFQFKRLAQKIFPVYQYGTFRELRRHNSARDAALLPLYKLFYITALQVTIPPRNRRPRKAVPLVLIRDILAGFNI